MPGSRTNPAFLVLGALAIVALAVSVLVATGGSEKTDARMVMSSALGLRDGSDVRVGGVSVGRVKSIGFTKSDEVQIDLALDENDVQLGRGVSVAVKSLNLLGEKYLALDPGKPSADGRADFLIPPSRVTTATDLDQLLDVLDADTRTRLGILINEAGLAVTGRRDDFQALLQKLPPTLTSATRLLDDVVADNRSLAQLITSTDGFLERAVTERKDLGRFVDAAAGAATTFAQRRDDLKETIARAPGGLSQLRGFLADLRTAVRPLGPAARNISATAPELSTTLKDLGPFRAAAKPVLAKAKEISPSLTDLGRSATPVVRKSVPTLQALDSFATRAKPLTRVLGDSTPDLLGVLEGWGRAIQGRDGRGHAFHGGVTFGANVLQSLLEDPASAPKQQKARKKSRQPTRPSSPQSQSAPSRPRPTVPLPVIGKVLDAVPDAIETLNDTLESLTGDLTGGLKQGAEKRDPKALLDYLLAP